MPKDETFWNPYRLVPVRDIVSKKRPLTDEKFKANSGRIYCTIENLTPLFIGGNRNNPQFLTSNGKYIIPGSSLKGMLRSLAEIIGGGCSVTDSKNRFNKTYAVCDKVDSLCVTCRMFGMMERGKGAKVHKGNVCISDALIREKNPETKLFDVQLFNHATKHEPFYRTPQTGRRDGKSRKFYFHQPKRKNSVPSIPQELMNQAKKINAILPGSQFEFEIDFFNLEKSELELLVYILALEENVEIVIEDGEIPLKGPMRHKLGYAKPLGLGSCRIDLNKIEYFAAPAKRFSSLGQTENTVCEGDTLKTLIKSLTQRFVSDTSVTMQQVRKIMVWDENDPRDFAYPKNHWFDNASNSGKALKQI